MEIEMATVEKILEIINSLKNSSSCGPDQLNTKLIKMNSHHFARHLTLLINDSLKIGNFPSLLKVSKIIPIHKKDSKTTIGNYRPISLLNNLSKVFEKYINIHLNEYLIKNDLLMKGQHGYRKLHNCITCVSSVHDFICNKLEKRRKLIAIFLDLSKAFDCIDHEILLNKIKRYGIKNNNLKLFNSYLQNRTHFTEINNERSIVLETKKGVPQGSILGPILYSIFCNDISFFNSNDTKIFLYADDTCIIIDSNDYASLQSKCTEIMNKILIWFNLNRLTVNHNKSKFLIFPKETSALDFKLSINNVFLEKVQCLKYLGITMQNNLSWNEFANDKIKHLLKLKHLFKYFTSYLPTDKMLVLFKSLFISKLIYGIEFLGSIPNYLIDRLQIIQNTILKIILRKKRQFSTLELHKISNFLLIKDIIFNRQCIYIYDELNIRNSNVLKSCSEVHKYSTRNRNNIYLEKYSSINKNKILYSCTISYNSLPNYIKTINFRHKFKEELEKFLINKY